ncbi:hypothetical protein D0T53_06455 [Dysgonomonas sp. 216]|uniref:4'-phosphopantetheinyl transferase family protein n=1 Tax=Dysgonomonas sp. 216 TaxID=2302934 RepID=UPI0013D21849|nr:4'-phosphopantetheinyl transferase superfamily protein [Dysgonomonas sp. 216]NDW18555.1 hypothetical protein [Dysgonomonas sp. 216]
MLYLRKQTHDSIFAIWKITETKEELLQLLENHSILEREVLSLKSGEKVIERLAVRVLLKYLLGREVDIRYFPSGKPFMRGLDVYMSISHTHGYVAVIIGEKETLGIDIQSIEEKVKRVRRKFISAKEFICPQNELIHLLLHWSAKETVYKAIGKAGVTLTDEIHIEHFIPKDSGKFIATDLTNDEEQDMVINYMVTPDFVLTYT